MIHEEIARLEKLQRLAEKIHQEAKITDSKLDDIEAWIEDEVRRLKIHMSVCLGVLDRFGSVTLLFSSFGSTTFSSWTQIVIFCAEQ
jgi:hypothetical protein